MKLSQVPTNERDGLFKKIDKDFAAIERRHGPEIVGWAMRRHLKERADRDRIEREKQRLEAELAELNAK